MCSWSKNGPWVVMVGGQAYGPYTENQAPKEVERIKREAPNPNLIVSCHPMQRFTPEAHGA